MLQKTATLLVYVLNSDKIKLDNVKYKDSADVLLQVQGDRSKEIAFINSNVNGAKTKIAADFGATEAMVSWAEATEPVKPTKKKKKKEKVKTGK